MGGDRLQGVVGSRGALSQPVHSWWGGRTLKRQCRRRPRLWLPGKTRTPSPPVDDIHCHVSSRAQTYGHTEETQQQLHALEDPLVCIGLDC